MSDTIYYAVRLLQPDEDGYPCLSFFVFWKTKHFILALFFFFLHLLFFCLIRELDKSSQHDSRTAISSWLLLVEGIRFFNYRSSSIRVSLKLLHGHMMGISRNLWSRLVVWRLHSFWSTDHTNTPTKKTLPPPSALISAFCLMQHRYI